MSGGPLGDGSLPESFHGAVDLLDRLRCGDVLIGDGALGTELFARGLKAGDAPETWNLERPEVLEGIARLYAEAGAELVSTNTFGGSPIKLAACGLAGRMEEINRAAVKAVRRAVGGDAVGGDAAGAVGDRAFGSRSDGGGAVGGNFAGRRALVFGSVGPCGRLLTPYGDADPAEVRAGFVAQMQVLVDAGVDLIGIETMTDLREAVLAVQAGREVVGARDTAGGALATGGSTRAAGGGSGTAPHRPIPIAVTMTFEQTRRGFFTIMGNDIPTAAVTLAAAGADILGSNCGKGIDEMIMVARAFREATDRPLLFQPNAGLPTVDGEKLIYQETPDVFAARARDLVDAGASIVGGCCGTTPEHIRLVCRAVKGRRATTPPGLNGDYNRS